MARCDQGYLCEVCGDEVEDITDSDLYLRYVIGEIPVRDLMAAPERHLRCNPVLAQFIVDQQFIPVTVDGPFNKLQLGSEERLAKESFITRGWQRLQVVRELKLAIAEYPLDEIRQ